MIDEKVLSDMYDSVGIKKENLHNALREMGSRYLKREYRTSWSPDNPTAGYCYVVSEMVMHYLAPNGTKSYALDTPAGKHWFLKYPGEKVIDLTADQTNECLDYENAKQQIFIPVKNGVSKRAVILAEKLGLEKQNKKL